MSLQVENVPFTLRTGTGNQTVSLSTYPSMAIKAIIFRLAGIADASNATFCYGFDDGTTHIGTSVGMGDQFGVCLGARQYDAIYSLSCVTTSAFFGGAVPRVRGYVSSIGAGSFTITLDTNALPGSGWNAIVIGGTDVNCKVGIYDMTPGAGTVSVGFDPVAILKLGAITGVSSEVAGAYQGYGLFSLCGPDEQVGWGMACGAITTEKTSYQLHNVTQVNINEHSTTISVPVTLSAINDGFSVAGAAAAADWDIGYLAIGGLISSQLVQIIQGAANTAITLTDPVCAFFGSSCKPPTSGVGAFDANLMFGAYDGSTNISGWIGGVNGTFTRDAKTSASHCITLQTATGSPGNTINGRASCTLTPSNLGLSWSTDDGGGKEVWGLVLGNNPLAETNPCGGVTPPPCIPVPNIPENAITVGNGTNITGF